MSVDGLLRRPAFGAWIALACMACVPLAHAAGADVPAAASAIAVPNGRASERLNQSLALSASQGAIGNTLGEHSFGDSHGGTVRLAQLRGKPLLVSFIYTGCFQVCPTTTRTLKRAVEAAMGALGPESFNVVSVGFNLPFDSPDALRAFAQQQGVHLPNWYFLSPDPATLQRFADEVGFRYVPVAGGFDHVTQVTVVDARGVVTAQVYGDRFALSALVDALERALRAEPAERESTLGLLDRVRILCTYYDPVSGEYRFKYAILLELAGGLTGVVVLALFVARRGRATRRPGRDGVSARAASVARP